MMRKYGQLTVSTYHNRHKDLTEERKAELYKNLHNSYMSWVSNLSNDEKVERSVKYSNTQKQFWGNLTSQEKSDRMKHLWNGNISKLELRIQLILSKLMVSYTTQFELNNKFFDFRVTNTKLIIEVNGDYWHANPKIYKCDDLINYPNGSFRAKDIWLRDDIKNSFAESNGYTIVKIWEQEMKSLNDEDLENLLLERIGNVKHSND